MARWKEHLLTHYVGGAWRVPLAAQMLPLDLPGGGQGLTVAIAGAGDIARLKDWLAGPVPNLAPTGARVPDGARDDLARAMALEHGRAMPDCRAAADQMLARGLVESRARVILSHPQTALSACVLVDALHRCGDRGRGLALLHVATAEKVGALRVELGGPLALDWPQAPE